MADMTREEIDAKIAANEARSDAQVAAILAKIDMIIARLERLGQDVRDLSAQVSGIKKTVILTGITSVLAVMFGMAGFNAALLSNMAASFQSGKETGQWQSDIRKQAEETNGLDETTRLSLAKMEEDAKKISESIVESKRLNAENAALLQQMQKQLNAIKPAPGSERR